MNDNSTRIVVGLHRVVSYIDAKIEVIARRFGVTLSQYFILEALYKHGELSVNEIQEKILDSNAAISLVIKNLEKHKLISRRLDENDRRKNLLSLTDYGIDVIERAYPRVIDMYEEELKIWNDSDIKDLDRVITKFKDR